MEFGAFNFDILKFGKELIESTRPEHFYHYTTAEGLLGILSPKDKQLEFWLTDSRYFNDSEEYIGGLGVGRECLNKSRHSKLPLLINAKESLESHNGRICVLSLSSRGNWLSQWRAYSEDGGYSLKLKSKLFKDPDHLAYRYLAECIYFKAQLEDKVKKSIEWCVEQYQQASHGKSDNESKHILLHCSSGLSNLIRVLASVFKHESFKEEHEWRHVFQYPNAQEIQLRPRNGLLVPYTSVKFATESLESIIVAPGSRGVLAKSAAEDLLQLQCFKHKCQVESSDSTFLWE